MSERYLSALRALYALAPSGMILGLETVRAALAHFGDPQERFRVAHIAGTNGKGSTSAMIARALRASGRRVGLYTSPHLHRFAERIQCDGAPVDEATLGEALTEVLSARDRGVIPSLTLFEATTVAAWLCFARAGVEDVVLEVGLGGRLDATNVCAPTVCAITSIGLDHMALLGDTVEQIAREKAGILKTGVPYVVGPSLPGTAAGVAIDEVGARVGARRLDAASLRVVAVDSAGRARVATERGDECALGLAGAHQVDNARTALAVLRALGVRDEHALAGLSDVAWPARCERIANVLIDSAHNPEGTATLLAVLAHDRTEPRARALVFGASSDKDWRASLDALKAFCPPEQWHLCAANLGRATDPAVLASYAGGLAHESVASAVDRAKASVGEGGLVVVCGSIFVAAAARAYLLGEREDPPLGL
ncbi:MAG: folylpolyglutamate synthase/dihydrofolate synthase family protein [Polyangiales bacterium]